MQENMLKQVKDVFKDYRAINKELLDAKIKSMNLFKKTNSLELVLLSSQNIRIRDISSFENYIRTRFGIETITTKIQMEEGNQEEKLETCEMNSFSQVSNTIENEWLDIIEYISNKHPMIKAILKNSKISVDGNCANVMLEFNGKEFLQANKMDELLSEILYDIYGKKYKVCYIEEVSEDPEGDFILPDYLSGCKICKQEMILVIILVILMEKIQMP